MKNIALIILLLLPLVTIARNKDEIKPPKGANVVILRTNYSSVENALVELPRTLLSAGIGIENINEKIGFIRTGLFNNKGIIVQANVLFEKVDSVVIAKISGTFEGGSSITLRGTGVDFKSSPVVYGGMSGSPLRMGWDALINFTKYIPHSSISFISPDVKEPTKEEKIADPLYNH